jgi:hypothetical protein
MFTHLRFASTRVSKVSAPTASAREHSLPPSPPCAAGPIIILPHKKSSLSARAAIRRASPLNITAWIGYSRHQQTSPANPRGAKQAVCARRDVPASTGNQNHGRRSNIEQLIDRQTGAIQLSKNKHTAILILINKLHQLSTAVFRKLAALICI